MLKALGLKASGLRFRKYVTSLDGVIGLRVFRDDRAEGSGLFFGIRGSMLFENKW